MHNHSTLLPALPLSLQSFKILNVINDILPSGQITKPLARRGYLLDPLACPCLQIARICKHCPKNNLNLCIKANPVKVGKDALRSTVQYRSGFCASCVCDQMPDINSFIWFFVQIIFRLYLGQCLPATLIQ